MARLVEELIAAGEGLRAELDRAPAGRRTERAGAALTEWAYFVSAGPLRADDHGRWNYARGLARFVRTLAAASSGR
ncbi:hypothetical protein AB4039_22955 [Streptomyces sp. M-16]|uniref:hypothetical protein n=1 Tax=Streptomyces sp. M-16 TaxID=3233040 RepID=UPI0022550385